jgi:signal transduction histidine kinase
MLERMTPRRIATYRVIALLLLLNAHATAVGAPAPGGEDLAPIRLDAGWHTRLGDSPRDERGNLVWLREPVDSPGWSPAIGFSTPDGGPGAYNYLWLRTRLPDIEWNNPALYLPTIMLAIEVYVDDVQVYAFGKFESRDNAYSSVAHHVIPASADWGGKTLSIRVYSHLPKYIGSTDVSGYPQIGAERQIVAALVRESLESSLVGLFSIFVGILSLVIFLLRFREHRVLAFSFGVFATAMGLFYVFTDPLAYVIVQSPAVSYYVQFVCFLVFPVGLYITMEKVIPGQRVFRLAWVAHALFALVFIVLDLTGFRAIGRSMQWASMLLMLTIIVAIVAALHAAKRGRRGAQLLSVAFVVAGLTGLNDTLQGLRLIPAWHWTAHWGTLTVALVMLYTLERRFTEDHKLLRIYSRDLEDKSAQLEQYAHTLEDRVAERTRDLDAKNRELVKTLEELQNTQQQLIMSEKMASLGNLVAGVAHEVNNPVGAIHSAADVSGRAIGILSEHVGGETDTKSGRVRKALDVLRDSNAVIRTATQRVAEIVRSLRTFSRLDEAEYQETKLEEGLDSTITLVQHETKKRIEIVRDYGDTPRIPCYPNELNQVFMNIMMNAIHSIEGHGRIAITTRNDAENVYVSIKDTGEGISKQDLSRIFDPGFTTKGVGVGTGLGLSITYNIVKKHHGSIDVKSEPGGGTEFIVTLPLHANRGAA